MKSRIIWLGSQVDNEIVNDLCSKIMLLSAEDKKRDIYLYINSPGGSVIDGVGLYDIMNLVPNDIVTVGVGQASSMGQFLLAAGAKGKRFGTPNLRVLLHQPSGGFGGASEDIRRQAELINHMKHQLASITASNTGKTTEQVMVDGDRDRWFTAPEALEYGFIDHIVTDVDDVWRLSSGIVDEEVVSTKAILGRL